MPSSGVILNCRATELRRGALDALHIVYLGSTFLFKCYTSRGHFFLITDPQKGICKSGIEVRFPCEAVLGAPRSHSDPQSHAGEG